LAKEIAAELRAKFDLNTRLCLIWDPKALGLDVPTSTRLNRLLASCGTCLPGWDWIEGYRKEDIVKKMIDEIW